MSEKILLLCIFSAMLGASTTSLTLRQLHLHGIMVPTAREADGPLIRQCNRALEPGMPLCRGIDQASSYAGSDAESVNVLQGRLAVQ